MVKIYLKVDGTKISFLSVPNRDAIRLAVCPFKWLRLVMFCICGARGELHSMILSSTTTVPRWRIMGTGIIPEVKFFSFVCKIVYHEYILRELYLRGPPRSRWKNHHYYHPDSTLPWFQSRRPAARCILHRHWRTRPILWCHTPCAQKQRFVIILCDSSIIFCSSTFRRFSTIVLLVITPHLQFPGLMIFRTVCCWPRPCIRSSPTDLLPS